MRKPPYLDSLLVLVVLEYVLASLDGSKKVWFLGVFITSRLQNETDKTKRTWARSGRRRAHQGGRRWANRLSSTSTTEVRSAIWPTHSSRRSPSATARRSY